MRQGSQCSETRSDFQNWSLNLQGNCNKINYMDIDQTISQEEQQNPEIKYEQCPNCSRHFFEGKLELHLKLCTPQNPMLLSPKRTHPAPQSFLSSKSTCCPHCSTKIPAFLYPSHTAKCLGNLQRQEQEQILSKDCTSSRKSSSKMKNKDKQVTLPLIQKHPDRAKPQQGRDPYRIRVREDLRCLKLAEQVQQVVCSFCQRMFSKQASQRHIPICQKLRVQESFVSALRRRKGGKRGQKNGRSCMEHRRQELKQVNIAGVSQSRLGEGNQSAPIELDEAIK